ncbi:MAG: MerR family transcriptional regulator, partial [Acidimicrobiia bacterium]
MKEYRISEAAKRSGFSESALRFYEREGLVVPERLESGYRVYNDQEIESLRFVARGKQLGLTLVQITELIDLMDQERCDPVQKRMKSIIDERIRSSQKQIAQLVEFTAQLQDAKARLGDHTPIGPCDDECGCTGQSSKNHRSEQQERIPLSSVDRQISCSLDPEAFSGRIQEWSHVLADAIGRDPLPDGVRVRFHRHVSLTAIAQLAAAEQTCCDFFEFSIGIQA